MSNMRISNILNSYEVSAVGKKGQLNRMTRAEEKKDMVALSNQAKDYHTAAKAVKAVPDIRENIVSEIKQKIVSGNYHVSSSDIADKLLKDL